ncbi:hypothetical protein ACQ4M3_19195 [Leptolyngbya sp. AN03gr2]|uniref:hypothetical protein n=1 Tax=Leptolyngbya sp. AN03gr2 TaxID=3423364 RepID=UPI003D3183C0
MASFFEQSVERRTVSQAANALIAAGVSYQGFSQAQLIVDAQKQGLAFTDWMELRVVG